MPGFDAAIWRHWHPVLLDQDLGTRPKSVMLHGQELVLYRAPSTNSVHALHNVCPHRRARLSDGWVQPHVAGARLVCPYHGFQFAPDGRGESPGTPSVKLNCTSFETRQAYGAIWLRARPTSTNDPQAPASEPTDFPALGLPGFTQVASMSHLIEAPLEVVVDNFCEVEHTPTTHALFGYDAASLPDVRVTLECTDTTVRVVNEGRQKPIPRLIERAFGIHTGDTFIDDWTVHFSPVHIVYDQWWRDPTTEAPRPIRVHLGVFFVPVDNDQTRLYTFAFSNRPPSLLDPLLRPLLRRIVNHEVVLDQRRIERLADTNPDLRGTRLGRFDAALREHRKRIEHIYRMRRNDPGSPG